MCKGTKHCLIYIIVLELAVTIVDKVAGFDRQVGGLISFPEALIFVL